jgi:hypothetical protein
MIRIENMKVENVFLSTALAVALVLPSLNAGATSLAELNFEVAQVGEEVTSAQTPAGQQAVPPGNLESMNSRWNQFADLTDSLGTGSASPTSVPSHAPTILWANAEALYQTLLVRCEYWRDFAGAPGGQASQSDVAGRIAEFETGSQLQFTGTIDEVQNSVEAVEAKLQQIQDLSDALNTPALQTVGLGTSPTITNYYMNEFHSRLEAVCPAEITVP